MEMLHRKFLQNYPLQYLFFRAQYQIDEEADGIWLTHPHPALTESLQVINDNQRIVNGVLDVSLRPFGKVFA